MKSSQITNNIESKMLHFTHLQQQYETKIQGVSNKKEKLKVLIGYIGQLIEIDFDRALEEAEKARQLAVFERERKAIADRLQLAARCYCRKGDYYLSILKASEAIGYYSELNEHENIISCSNIIGGSFRDIAEYDKALEYLNKSYELCKKIGSEKKLPETLNNIGETCIWIKQYDKALEFFQQCEMNYRKWNDQFPASSLYINMGLNYQNQKKFSESLKYYDKGLEFAKKTGNTRGLATLLNNIGAIHIDLRNLSESLSYLTKCFILREKMGDKSGLATTYLNYGEVYILQNQYDKAEEALTHSRNICEALRLVIGRVDIHYMFYRLYTEKGDHVKADEHFRLMKEAKEEDYNEEKERKIKNLKLSIELEKIRPTFH